MSDVRRCLGCQATYPVQEHACPKCGSHAGETEAKEEKAEKAAPARRSRKT